MLSRGVVTGVLETVPGRASALESRATWSVSDAVTGFSVSIAGRVVLALSDGLDLPVQAVSSTTSSTPRVI